MNRCHAFFHRSKKKVSKIFLFLNFTMYHLVCECILDCSLGKMDFFYYFVLNGTENIINTYIYD